LEVEVEFLVVESYNSPTHHKKHKVEIAKSKNIEENFNFSSKLILAKELVASK